MKLTWLSLRSSLHEEVAKITLPAGSDIKYTNGCGFGLHKKRTLCHQDLLMSAAGLRPATKGVKGL